VSARTLSMRAPVEPRVALLLAMLGGTGCVLAAADAAMRAEPLALAGAAAAAAALVVLVGTDWLDGAVVVALAVPLPAVYDSPALRVAAAAPVAAIVVLAWLLRRGVSDGSLQVGAIPVRSSLLLAAALGTATIAATAPAVSARELVNLGLLAALLVLATDAFAGRPDRVRRALGTLVVAAAACGALAVLEMTGILPGRFPRYGTAFNRAALGFGQPNGLGLFFALALPLAAYRWTVARDRTARALAAAACALIAAGLLATFSRGAWLSVLGGTAALLLTRDVRFALRIWAGALIAAVVTDVVTGGALRDTFARTIDDWVIEQRAALVLAGILMFLAHPLLGVGPGGFAVNLDRVGAQLPQLWDYLPTPHNAYVQMAAETGIVGLLAFAVVLVALLRTFVRRVRETPAADPEERVLRRALLWSFATLCCAGFVVWPFAHGTGEAVALLIAAGIAPRAPGVASSAPRVAPHAPGGASSAPGFAPSAP
jgi:putative inorganic carbon (hco3(-)) transporter